MTLYKKGPKSLASQKAKIFDTFIFFNELDLLTLRLNILDDVVDKFVLVESTKTFQGKNKPLFFNENKKKYSKFLKKIIHIIVDDIPSRATAWEREHFQRNAISRGLGQCSNSDLIIISDLDEIPNLKSLPAKLEDNFFYIFELSLNYYYFNNRCIQMPNWYGSILTKYKNIKGSIQEIRDLLFKVQNEISSEKNIEFVKNAGWHFSYLASPENIAIKIQSFSHTEFNNEKYTNLMTIQNHIKNNEDIFNRSLDFEVTPISQLPSYVQKNIKKYITMGFIKQNVNNLDLNENVNLSLKSYFKNNQGKVSDKWSYYLDQYERLFKPLRDKDISLLEIGIQNGGSLEIWSKYFPKAKIFVGCDIDERCSKLFYEDQRVNLIIGDANQKIIQDDVIKKGSPFDIVIDDGSHQSRDIIKSFMNYFPHVADSGIYIVEDLHCSYWEEFEGGLYASYSSISFFKHLTDLLNYEHWGIDKSYKDFLDEFSVKFNLNIEKEALKKIESIEFLNSMCIIRKTSGSSNDLGLRIVNGSKDYVRNDLKKLNSTRSVAPDQSRNLFSIKSPQEEILYLERELQEQKNINNLILNSNSWKVTSPLRFIKNRIRTWTQKISR